MILAPIQTNATDEKPSTKVSIIFSSTIEDGTQVEFTVSKTGSDQGAIREKRRRKGNDPTKDKPDSDETIKIYQIRVRSDGTELVGKAEVLLTDPVVTFTLNRPEDQDPGQKRARPTITLIVKGTSFGLKDRTTIYKITHGKPMDADYNRYDTVHAVWDHPLMSRVEWNNTYQTAWRSFYTVNNMITALKRCRSDKDCWDLLKNMIWYRWSIATERTHPMIAGFYKVRRYHQRRPEGGGATFLSAIPAPGELAPSAQ
jgi:hypothetical protein